MLSILLKIAVPLLLVARLLVPTESAPEGDTLWLTQCWLAAGLLWAWNCFRERNTRLRLDWLDLAVWGVVGGHVVSALYVVFARAGEPRAALNMLWEWVGLGVSFFLIRQVIRTRDEARRLIAAIVLTVVALAGMGIWQHYIFYPQAVADYDQLRQELDELEHAPPAAAAWETAQRARRIQQLQREMSQEGIPLEGQARSLWEDRLRSSTEPLGFFALANSFAGLLAVWLIVGLGLLSALWHARSALLPSPDTEGDHPRPTRAVELAWRSRILPWAICLSAIAYCLILTKSRTAWIGLVVGLAGWGGLALRRRKQLRRAGSVSDRSSDRSSDGPSSPERTGVRKPPWLAATIAVVVIFGGLLLAAAFSGGFDREVISEAPKSLRYRLQYWTATWNVIREHPILGTGPGNFRVHYLKYKLPESSEEIADPHNFLLDLWTSGGLLALVSFLALLFLASAKVAGTLRVPSAESHRRHTDHAADGTRSVPATFQPRAHAADGARSVPATLGAAAGFLVVFLVSWLFAGNLDFRHLAVFGGWAVLMALFGKRLTSASVSASCLAAAAVALLVHLLGAGGIEMPAIAQTLLLLIALTGILAADGEAPSRESNATARPEIGPAGAESSRATLLIGVAMLPLFFGCLVSATIPVISRRALVSTGDAALLESGNTPAALARYADAAQVDPFSPEPLQRLAETMFRRWKYSAIPAEKDFENAVAFSKLALQRNPYSPHERRALGRWYLEKFERDKDPQDAQAAVAHLGQAAERYPNHAGIRAELARAHRQAGRLVDAGREARRALELDEINRREGHRDKYLPAETLEKLQELVRQAK